MNSSTFTGQLVALLGMCMGLGFLYAIIPIEISAARWLIAMVQLGFMVITMAVTIRWVLEDY